MKARVTLSIGYPTASHEDILDIDDVEYAECETDEQRQNLLNEYWQDWSNNYIDGSVNVVEPQEER